MFAAPEPYPAQATDSQHAGVQMILNSVREEMKSDRRITTSRKRGFRSFAVGPERAAQTLEIDDWAKDVAKLVRAVRSTLQRLIESGSVTIHPRTT